MKILIIGLGSIGKRHMKIIKELNINSELYALRSSKSANFWYAASSGEILKYKFDLPIDVIIEVPLFEKIATWIALFTSECLLYLGFFDLVFSIFR